MWSLLERLDSTLMTWLRAWDAPWLDAVMRWISASGGAGLIWIVLGLIALSRPANRAAAWRVMLTLMLAYLLVDGMVQTAVSTPASGFGGIRREPETRVAPAAAFVVVPIRPRGVHVRCRRGGLEDVAAESRRVVGAGDLDRLLAQSISAITTRSMWPVARCWASRWHSGCSAGVIARLYASTLPSPLPAGVLVKP